MRRRWLPRRQTGEMTLLPETMITRPEELGPCCEELARGAALGFDTEFVGEDSFHPCLCLVQVATAERLYLIDPLSAGPLDAFWKLILDPNRVVVVHAGREEVRLCRLWTGLPPGSLFDLQLAAGLAGFPYPLSHGALVQQVLGVSLTKGETLTEWRHRPLTPAQLRYAYDDVRHLLAIYEKVRGRLRAPGPARLGPGRISPPGKQHRPGGNGHRAPREAARPRRARSPPAGRGPCLVSLARAAGGAPQPAEPDDLAG